MRSHLRQGLGASSGITCNLPGAYDDDAVISSITTCMQSAAANPAFVLQVSAAWAVAESTVAAQAADYLNAIKSSAAGSATTGAAVALVVQAGENSLVDFLWQDLGWEAAAEWLDTAFITITNAADAATSAITLGTASGSGLGPVGAVVGFIIGAIIAILDILGSSCNVQITDGRTYDCGDYVNNNLKQALAFMQELSTSPSGTASWSGIPVSLVGMTPKWLEDTFGIFLANPVWLYANQQFTGIAQGQPPPGWAGDPMVMGDTNTLTKIYFTAPGAFEILNRVQLTAAAALVAATPSKLPFYASLIGGGGERSWSAYSSFPQISNTYQPVARRPWTPGALTTDINSLPIAIYEACPNLGTNTNALIPNTNGIANNTTVGPPTNPYGYVLQSLYPSLSTSQCNAIFNANFASYVANIQAAQAWLNSIGGPCYPVPSDLGSGSQWNLEPPDVAICLANWTRNRLNTACLLQPVPPGWTPPSKIVPAPPQATTAGTSTGTAIVKGASVVGGVAAIGLALYAAHTGVSVPAAARTLYSGARSFVKRRMVKRVRR